MREKESHVYLYVYWSGILHEGCTVLDIIYDAYYILYNIDSIEQIYNTLYLSYFTENDVFYLGPFYRNW